MSTATVEAVVTGGIVLQIKARQYLIKHSGEVYLIEQQPHGPELTEVFGDELEQVILAGLPYTEIPF